ncbi:hypothetical protein [Bacterioplanoides sp.]|uniref:hypothetical protein n=1 Tax=Bacterioplanoides sp. TaxID=2066072 RepID=UPI003B5BC964
MAKILICDQPVIQPTGEVACSAWQVADYESLLQQQDLNQLSQILTDFDPVLFAAITGGLLLSFAGAHIAGVVVKTMNRS